MSGSLSNKRCARTRPDCDPNEPNERKSKAPALAAVAEAVAVLVVAANEGNRI